MIVLETKNDIETILSFYKPDEIIELRGWRNLYKWDHHRYVMEKRTVHFYSKASEVNKIKRWLKNKTDKYDLFIGAQPRKMELRDHNNRCIASRTSNVCSRSNVVLDWDKDEDGEQITLDEVERRISAYPKPNVLVSSGHGYHAWWFNVPNADEVQKKLIIETKSDDKANHLDMIFRLPGSTNFKRERKPCAIISTSNMISSFHDDLLAVPRYYEEEKCVGTDTSRSVQITWSQTLDEDKLSYLVEKHPVKDVGTRNKIKAQLIYSIRVELGSATIKDAVSVHDAWYRRWQQNIRASIEESRKSFIHSFKTMPIMSHKGAKFWENVEMKEHPLLHLIPKGKRYDNHRKLANRLYSAAVKRNQAQIYDSYKLMMEFLGINKSSIAVMVKNLVRWGLIKIMSKGWRWCEDEVVTSKASTYEVQGFSSFHDDFLAVPRYYEEEKCPLEKTCEPVIDVQVSNSIDLSEILDDLMKEQEDGDKTGITGPIESVQSETWSSDIQTTSSEPHRTPTEHVLQPRNHLRLGTDVLFGPIEASYHYSQTIDHQGANSQEGERYR